MCNFYANEMSFFENLSPAEYNVTVLLIGERAGLVKWFQLAPAI